MPTLYWYTKCARSADYETVSPKVLAYTNAPDWPWLRGARDARGAPAVRWRPLSPQTIRHDSKRNTITNKMFFSKV